MITIAIIGCGYWGPNYIRVCNELKGCQIRVCCDLDIATLNMIKAEGVYSKLKRVTDYRAIANDTDIDAVIISTPLNNHYEIAKACLKNGKHILVEKPFTSNSKQAMELIKIAEKNKLILMAGHIYKYNPGVLKLKTIIKNGTLGDIYYINAQRMGLGPIRKQVSALWDLATHDISIALDILGEFPLSVTAVGEYYIQKDIRDLVFVSLKFPSRAIYNILVSWLAPEKVRKTTIVGTKGMAVFDDVNKDEMIKVYEKNINKELLDSTPRYVDHQRIVKMGKDYVPRIRQAEPLKIQVKHFLECIIRNKRPISDGYNGLMVVKVLEAAERSLKNKETVRCRLKM